MILMLKLLIAHVIGDFVLQPDSWVRSKKENKWKAPALYAHIAVHLLISFLIVWDIKLLIGVLLLGLSHLLIDLWKVVNETKSNERALFFIDQFFHLFVIVGVAEYYSPFAQECLGTIDGRSVLLMLLAILLITIVSSQVVRVLISKWTPENEDRDEDSLSKAGSYIGMLERLFVFGFLVSGYVEAIGFLLAAKSVFRFGDLKDSKDRKLTEYILIGTLLSFGIAMLVGMSYLKLKKLM